MVAVRAVAWNIILARERRDLGHFFYGVVVLQIKVGDAVARRHGFLASGAARCCGSYESGPLSVQAHLRAAARPRAPAVLWGVSQLFEADVHGCESLQKTMPLSNECLRVVTRTLTMPTAHRALGALALFFGACVAVH